MPVNPAIFGLQGFAFPLGISDDYPPVGDVVAGVSYASGLLVGTFVVPSVSVVTIGVGYGAGGTQYVGTLTQSVSPSQPGPPPVLLLDKGGRASAISILTAVQGQICNWLGFPLDRIKIIVPFGRKRPVPKMSAEQDILLELGGFSSEAGERDRHDCRILRQLVVTIRTRAERDEADRDDFFMKDTGQGSIIWEEDIIDALQNYWPENAARQVLTSSAMRALTGTKRQKIEGDLAWGEVDVVFGLPVRLPLTQGVFP